MEKRNTTKNCRKQTTQHEKWLKMWGEFEQETQQLPAWKRKILIDDLGVAFRSRIAIMSKVGCPDQRKATTNRSTFALHRSA